MPYSPGSRLCLAGAGPPRSALARRSRPHRMLTSLTPLSRPSRRYGSCAAGRSSTASTPRRAVSGHLPPARGGDTACHCAVGARAANTCAPQPPVGELSELRAVKLFLLEGAPWLRFARQHIRVARCAPFPDAELPRRQQRTYRIRWRRTERTARLVATCTSADHAPLAARRLTCLA